MPDTLETHKENHYTTYGGQKQKKAWSTPDIVCYNGRAVVRNGSSKPPASVPETPFKPRREVNKQ